jgi:hypothetical protein
MFAVLGNTTNEGVRMDHHFTTYDENDPHAAPAYDGNPADAWMKLDSGEYPGTYTNPQGVVWAATLVVAPGGMFSHVVPVSPIESC